MSNLFFLKAPQRRFVSILQRCQSKAFVRTVLPAFIFLFVSAAQTGFAQSTGFINRKATATAGINILDPNGDDYTSATSGGYFGNDVANSELPYRPMPALSEEPFGDLRRGPNHLYSDFVPDANKKGYYVYYDNTNLLFRWRMGSVMSGSKGYSVLIDTDGRFGATGPQADPNYQPETTGTNGNPGFEIEIVLETNFRIAIYNVDGTSNPVLVKAYNNWQDMSQVSIAGTFDNGDPDFFIDFYVPFADLQAAPFNLSPSTPLRMSATTVMAPKAAIGGPKSDIYGGNDAAYKSTNTQYEDYINLQPAFTATGLNSSGIAAVCTQPPVVTSPIGTGTVTITGTWTKSAIIGATTADITVYRDGIAVGTITGVGSGATWLLPGVSVANNNVITAKAQAAGESMCLSSNAVTAQGCNPSNIPSTTGFTLTCSSRRGFEGTFAAGNQVNIYFVNPTTLVATKLAGPVANGTTFGYSGANWYYNGTDFNGSQIASACSGGSQDLANGVYYFTTVAAGGTCESAPIFTCVNLAGTTTAPTVTQTALYTSSTTLSGSATTGDQVWLYINGQRYATTTAAAGSYSFSLPALSVGDAVNVYTISANNCISAAVSRTVSCFSVTPLITVDNNNQLRAGQPITGTSGEPAGTTIHVYTAASLLVSTVTVQSGGTWTTGAYTAVAGTSYYATAQNGTCAVSTASGTFAAAAATANRCGAITGPVTAATATISGTLTGAVAGTVVNLYIDNTFAGSVTTGADTWSLAAASLLQPLYANAVLTIGVQESGRTELLCSASPMTVTCNTGPPAPVVSPSNSTIFPGYTQTYTVSNAVPGAFYGLADASTGRSLGDGVWATSATINLTTYVFTSGTYSVVVKGTSLSGVSVCGSPATGANVLVTVPNNTTDVDDDNDGIPDLAEHGGIDPFGDADSDGILNYLDATPGGSLPAFSDTNSDGINDAYDADKDGIINSLDLDSDNDGIADLAEAGGVDTNGDGKVDGTADTDNDGLIDLYDSNNGGVNIANLDTDGDGITNAADLDSDNDGIPDVVETGGTDGNNDGLIDAITDTDLDGFIDSKDGDVGNDGTAENTANALLITGPDGNGDGRPDSYPRNNTDRTGLPNAYDLDADGDGVLDTREAGIADSNNDGIADGVTGPDGWSNTVDALPSLSFPNTDGRNGANYLDIDADDDGITDNAEAQSTSAYLLPSGNDADGDGIDDNYDNNDALFAGNASNGSTPNNHDGADDPDYLDSDTDNDGVNDLKEGTGNLSATLSGLTDTDGDGLLDQFDTFNASMAVANWHNNVTLTGMGNNGSPTGPATAGSNVSAYKTMAGASDRDWRNLSFILPVHLVRFGVIREAGNALIRWETANESGMKEYLVERSVDGMQFNPVATVQARPGVTNSYAITDHLQSINATKLYYRLQQVSVNGSTTQSRVVSLDLGTEANLQLAITPNPASGPVMLTVKTAKAGKAILTVYNAAGKRMIFKNLVISAGTTSVSLEGESLLSNGTYLVSVSLNGSAATQRCAVQR